MEAVCPPRGAQYYSTGMACHLYSTKALGNIASTVCKYLNITISYDTLQATFSRSQHHQSRQVQQMAAPLTDERRIQHASGVYCNDAQEAGPPELLRAREDDGRYVGAELERILPCGLDGGECAAIHGLDLLHGMSSGKYK